MALLSHLKGPISKTSLVESVYAHLLEAILTGALPSGTELSELTLAAELGVSRTPIRSALLRLAADGLIEHLANRRDRVARFTHDDIREIYEMRTILECAAAEKATRLLDEKQLSELRAEADALADAPNSRNWSTQAIDFDIRFHDLLAAAVGNERLRKEITKYRYLVRAFCRISGNPENLRQAMEEHRRILSALEARDPTAARRAMAAHIAARLQAVLREVEETGTTPS
jgi:GntR family transcriptional regulator, rspAB operon transcriptional repressor